MREKIEELKPPEGSMLTIRFILDERDANGMVLCICDCVCGTRDIKVRHDNVTSGNTKSCGCLKSDSWQSHAGSSHSLINSSDSKTLNKECEGCHEPFEVIIGLRTGVNSTLAKKIKFCEKCRMKKKLGTRPSKDDW